MAHDDYLKKFHEGAEEGKKLADEVVLPHLGGRPDEMLSDFFAGCLSGTEDEKQQEILRTAITEMDQFSGHETREDLPQDSRGLLEEFEEAADRATDKIFEETTLPENINPGSMDETAQMDFIAGEAEKRCQDAGELSPSVKGQLYGFVRGITEEVLSRAKLEEELNRDILKAKVMGAVSIGVSIAGMALIVGVCLPESVIGVGLAAVLAHEAVPCIAYFMIVWGLLGQMVIEEYQEEKEQLLDESKVVDLSEDNYVII